MPKTGDFASLLDRSFRGDKNAESDLCLLVNNQLRATAARLVRRYNASARASSLVNEAFMAMFRGRSVVPETREHFFAIATEQMRQLLRERWRKNAAQKRGGHLAQLHLEEVNHIIGDFDRPCHFRFEDLDRELERLRNTKSTRIQYKIIKYRFFGGLSVRETAELLSLPKSTVEREWRLVRAKLRQQLQED